MTTTGSDDAITFVISVAAELSGMHPQTLRQYDRLGLVIPARTKGRGRRYTKRDVQRLRDVQRMSQEEGINLAGIRRILELERRVEALEAECEGLRAAVLAAEARRNRVFAASPDGQVMPMRRGQRSGDRSAQAAASSSGSLTVWNPMRALAALSATGGTVGAAAPRAGERVGVRAVVEGTIVSRR
ncbi:heat-shock protein HspR [Actinomyces sp. HMSC062G12]|nr:heat-shock protein HspR [Actinomyces sp. HMSC062G12]